MPLVEAGCKGRWREPVQARVWTLVVIVDPRLFNDPPSGSQAAKQMLVEALVSEPAVEALNEPVLLRFARRNGVPQHRSFLLPTQYRMRFQIRAVVAHDHGRTTTALDHEVRFADDLDPGQRCVDDQPQALSGEAIHDRQNAKPAPVVQSIRDKVQRPALVRPQWQRHGRRRAKSPFAAAALPHTQPFLAIQPKQPLMVQ